jgi:hypothetical protein
VGLKRASYCIFNKQYTKEQYEELAPRIIEHMQKTGEWGEFFPTEIASHAYNETIAPEYFPLAKEHVRERGWKWKDADPKQYLPANAELPDRSMDASDSIAKSTFACDRCGRNYRIIQQELALYRQMPVPLPALCSSCRHDDRMQRRTPYKLWSRKCAKCSSPIKTAFSPERPEIVYCEECYLKEVY